MENINTSLTTVPLMKIQGNAFEKKYSEKKSHQLKKIVVSTVAGDGTEGFLDGPVLTSKFKSPLDVAILADGTIYVADAFASRIRKIKDGIVTTFAGNGNANIKNGSGNEARFKIPSRLTVDPKGNLYTLDAADPRIRKITPEADVSIYAGAGIFGFKDGKATVAKFGQSFGIITDVQGNIYLADSQNDCIRKISVRGEVTTVVRKSMHTIIDDKEQITQFRFVTGIVLDKNGNLFVSDVSRIQKITPQGVVTTFAGSIDKGYADGNNSAAKFSQIEDMSIDLQENIYVTDEHRIRKITPQGVVSTIAGSIAGYKDGDATCAKFDRPHGLTIDKEGNIYVADFNNKRIRKISFE